MESDIKFFILLAIIVVILDSLAILTILKTSTERRKSTTMILISLLTSDILIGAVVIPTRIVETMLFRSEIFPYIYAYIIFVAAFNILFLTLDRYTSIGKPFWRKLISNGRVANILASTWIAPAFISLLPLTWKFTAKYKKIFNDTYRYLLVAVLLFIIVTVALLQSLVLYELYCFWSSWRKNSVTQTASRSRRSKTTLRKRAISTILIIGITISTISTWLPTIVLNFCPGLSSTWIVSFSLYACFLNSLVDPMLVLCFNFGSYLQKCRCKNRKRENNPQNKDDRQSKV